MSFGETILRKYGWTQGKGLGKNEDGIAAPVRASLKFDQTGVGYDTANAELYGDKWWTRTYNDTSKGIDVKNKNGNVIFKSKKKKTKKIKVEEVKSTFELSDEQLFQACGGITCHKAARHGFNMDGKLARLRKQDEQLLASHEKKEKNSGTENKNYKK
ncbi:G patch domain-containing protein 4 [Melanaphis sacchari]|uniref:G patch domain-containing protein 4 n=1 Tax=Melanaphis sacchari TaxID=742174 RepID=UPI000DC133FF|nr:G patch domain-containing protein 4 [Melanaphis sacchari]